MAENKRNYLQSNDTYNHDAGSGAVVGAYGHPTNAAGNNWLGVQQGDSAWQREGDAIYSKYIDYRIYLEAHDNRMHTQCRVIIVKGTGNNTNDYNSTSIADWFITDGQSSGSGNLMSQPVDTRKFTVLKDFVIAPLSSSAGGLAVTGAQGNNTCMFPLVSGRLKTGYKVLYKTGSEYPSKSSQRIQIAIIPYNGNSSGTQDNCVDARIELVHHFCDF
jgi:hypothetical protein